MLLSLLSDFPWRVLFTSPGAEMLMLGVLILPFPL